MSDIKRIESLEEYPCADPQYVSRHTAFWVDQAIVYFEILNPEQAISTVIKRFWKTLLC